MIKDITRRILRADIDDSLMANVRILRNFLHPTDLRNRALYGPDAPRYGDRILIDPRLVKGVMMPRRLFLSGQVVESFPPVEEARIIPLREHPKIGACLEHWEKGVPWSQTKYLSSIIAAGKGKYGGTPERVDAHWSQYDRMLDVVKREGRLRRRAQIYRRNFREQRGILVHIDKDGSLYQGNSGNRRFAIALVAGLPVIPAQVGCVHVEALEKFKALRCTR